MLKSSGLQKVLEQSESDVLVQRLEVIQFKVLIFIEPLKKMRGIRLNEAE